MSRPQSVTSHDAADQLLPPTPTHIQYVHACSCVTQSREGKSRLRDVLPAPRPRRRNASLPPFLVNTSTPISSTEPRTPDSDRLQHGKLVGRGGGASTSGPAPRRPRHSPHPPSRRVLCGVRCSGRRCRRRTRRHGLDSNCTQRDRLRVRWRCAHRCLIACDPTNSTTSCSR